MKVQVLASCLAILFAASGCKARQPSAATVKDAGGLSNPGALNSRLDVAPILTDKPLNADNIAAGKYEDVIIPETIMVIGNGSDESRAAPLVPSDQKPLAQDATQLGLTDSNDTFILPKEDDCNCVKTNLGYCGVWKSNSWVSTRFASPGAGNCDIKFCVQNFSEVLKKICSGRAVTSDGLVRLEMAKSPVTSAASSGSGSDAGSGSGSASGSASALSTPAGAGAQCGCKSLKVDCTASAASGYGTGAACNSAECRLSFAPDICAARAYKHGQVIDPAEILNAPLPRPDSVDIYRECTVRHEAKHGCSDNKSPGFNQKEVAAYALSLNCFWRYYQALGCDNGSGHYLCGYASANYNSHRAGLFLNSCFASGELRQACVAKCDAAPELDHQYCKPLDDLYGAMAAQATGDKPK